MMNVLMSWWTRLSYRNTSATIPEPVRYAPPSPVVVERPVVLASQPEDPRVPVLEHALAKWEEKWNAWEHYVPGAVQAQLKEQMVLQLQAQETIQGQLNSERATRAHVEISLRDVQTAKASFVAESAPRMTTHTQHWAQGEYWPTAALVQQAKAIEAEWEQPNLSGEHKRHQVYARLIKEHPDVDRRTIALSIELGLLP